MALVLSLAMMSFACASTTVIRSNPPGASITSVEGGYSGRTPFTYSDSNIVGTTRAFTIAAPGYEPQTLIIKKDQWDAGRLVLSVLGGLILLVPYVGILWSADYEPVYEVHLKPSGDSDYPPPPNVDAPTSL
ncbi:MAG: PEGA domain-containing protein [Myxococcaceae bacterium]